jgi:IclR helix-turn-helix domain
VSELLDRIRREIRERLEASRAAVREHERLEAALYALGGAGSRATRAVRGSGRDARAPARPSSPAVKPSGARARSRQQSPAGRRSGASAKARQPASATADGRSGPARRSGSRAAASAETKKGQVPRAAGPATAARKRAPRGANREAVLSVVGERPGVTARELAAASGVTGGTLYSLLRTLTQQGALEKRALPGGPTGYVVAASAVGAQAAVVPPGTANAPADADDRTVQETAN